MLAAVTLPGARRAVYRDLHIDANHQVDRQRRVADGGVLQLEGVVDVRHRAVAAPLPGLQILDGLDQRHPLARAQASGRAVGDQQLLRRAVRQLDGHRAVRIDRGRGARRDGDFGFAAVVVQDADDHKAERDQHAAPAPADRTVSVLSPDRHFLPAPVPRGEGHCPSVSPPLAPVLRGEGSGGGGGDSVQVLGTAIRQAIRGPALLIALGLFGVLIALGFVIIRILHNDGSGTEVAVPTVASATINPDGSVAVKLPDGSPQKLLVTKRAARRFSKGQWVPLVKSVDDLQAWQRRGNGTVAYINNALQLQDAAVSYPTLAMTW